MFPDSEPHRADAKRSGTKVVLPHIRLELIHDALEVNERASRRVPRCPKTLSLCTLRMSSLAACLQKPANGRDRREDTDPYGKRIGVQQAFFSIASWALISVTSRASRNRLSRHSDEPQAGNEGRLQQPMEYLAEFAVRGNRPPGCRDAIRAIARTPSTLAAT